LPRDAKARHYFLEGAGDMNPSRADFALGCKLAFYTSGNLQQMYRLFMLSALGKRPKVRTKRGDVDYLQYTLERCLTRQTQFYRARPKDCSSVAAVGRPVSKMTKDVLRVRRQNPTMRACDIGRKLGVNAASVRKILSRYPTSESVPSVPPMNTVKILQTRPQLSSDMALCDIILQCFRHHRGWVQITTISKKTGQQRETVKRLLDRLETLGEADRDRRGRYRAHRERRPRKLKPCCEKPIPKCRMRDKQRKTLTRTELVKRGWPRRLIDAVFTRPGEDYREREIVIENLGRIIKARFYRVSRIKQIEKQPWFESERVAQRALSRHISNKRENL
jgi:hypothetical protein